MPDQTRCSVCHHASLWRITVLVRIRNWHFVGKKIRLRLAYVRRPRRRIHWRLFGWLWFGGHIYSPGFAWAWGSARHRSRVAASGGERVFFTPHVFLPMASGPGACRRPIRVLRSGSFERNVGIRCLWLFEDCPVDVLDLGHKASSLVANGQPRELFRAIKGGWSCCADLLAGQLSTMLSCVSVRLSLWISPALPV